MDVAIATVIEERGKRSLENYRLPAASITQGREDCNNGPETRPHFTHFVRQCELCHGNKERNTLPVSDAQTIPFPSEIFLSYAIHSMGLFIKLKGQDSVLIVVDRAVGSS